MTGRGGARQVLNGLVQIEHESARQPANIGEMPLGACPLLPCNMRFPTGGNDTCNQAQHEGAEGGDAGPVPTAELQYAVGQGCGTGGDGKSSQVTTDIQIELLDRGVALRGILLQGSEHHSIQIAGEFEPQTMEAFRRLALDRQTTATVTAELKMSAGAVYMAKSRVLQRLRQLAEGLVDWSDQ